MHTSIAAGRDVAELLGLAVLLQTRGTVAWLQMVSTPLDLRSQAAALTQKAARDRDTPTALGLATVGSVGVMLAAGAVDLAQAVLDSVTVPTSNPQATQLAGALALSESLATAEGLHPEVHPYRSRQAVYWRGYGRALVQVRGRHDDAVLAFHRAETISPVHLHHNPLARDALATLVTRSRQDAVGRELRGMAYRAGLPV